MASLTPAVLAALVATVLLLAVYGYVYALYRERCVGIWAVSWATFIVHSLAVMAGVGLGDPPAVLAVNQVALLAASWLLAWGAYAFVGRPLPRIWTLLALPALAWVLVTCAAGASHSLVSWGVSIYASVAYVAVGVLILRHRALSPVGRWVVGVAIVLWGVHKLDYPLLRDVEWFAPYGFGLAATLALATGVGILLVYFERVRDQLARAQDRLRRFIDEAGDFAFLLDAPSGRFLSVNRTACEALGFTEAELLGEPFERVSLGYTSAALAEVFVRPLMGRTLTLEDRLRARNGRTFPVEIHVSRIDEAGRPLALAFARDIRERWRAQAERSIVSEVAKTFLDATSLVEVHAAVPRILAKHLRYPMAALVLHEAATDELVWAGCHGFGSFVPAGTRVPMGDAIVGEVIRDGQPLALADAREHPHYRSPVLRRFGLRAFVAAPFRVRGQVVGALSLADNQERDDMAEAAATLGIVADYLGQELDRRRMETALGRELQIDAALAGLTRALLAPEVDARRSAALVLEEALRLTGSARGAVAGLAGTLRVAPRNAGDPEAAGVGDPALARWGADLPDALVCGGPPAPPEEGEPSRPEGVTRFVAVPVRSAAGRLAHLVVADAPEGYGPRDQRAVEQLAEVLALALQRRIAEDERQALQEQVWEAQKMQGLGTLAGGIAHDFNNILSAVLGFAELSVDRAGGDPELHENLEEIVRACRRAADLVRQILTFGRRTLDERQLLRPHLIVVETLKLLRASLPAAVRIERDIDEDTGPILAHPAQLQQVVMNLCTNAFQAMGERGGTLRVRLRSTAVAPGAAGVPPELRAGRHVVLTVADTGVGMSDETRARIFEPYFTTKPLGEGTGLGLSVVHGVVAALEGAITVESAPGAGAAFRVWLPEQSAAIEAAAEAAPEVPRAGCGRVLLVDDEQTVMTVARHMLGRLGYDVTAFDDPATALAAFAHDPDDWDAVVTDLNMPGIDGIELTTVVRARRRDLPVVLMTGHLDDGARRRLEAAGAVIQVMKPISTGALGHAVQRALAAGSAPEAAAAPSGGRRADSATIRA